MTSALAETLAMVADTAAGVDGDWWIIGSAAVVLQRRRVNDLTDVDLLMSASDAEAFLRQVGETPRIGEPSDHFRSRVFGTWKRTPLAVEVMGGFSVATPSGWRPVCPRTRETIRILGREIFVPSAGELAELLLAFGRPKDLARAHLLRG